MKIIGFGHRSRVGKDTAAKFLETHLRVIKPGLTVKRIGFADKLKEVTSDLLGVPNRIYYENNPEKRTEIIEEYGCDIVELWIKVGNKMREIHAEIWVNHVLRTKADVLIIPDVRFPNEVERIKEKGGSVYKIERDSAPIRDSVSDAALDLYTGWDGVFLNDGSLERLLALMEGLGNHIVKELESENAEV